MILYMILFVIYFCFTSCLFHDKSIPTPEYISDISRTDQEPDFYEQVKTLMTDDTDIEPETLITDYWFNFDDLPPEYQECWYSWQFSE